MDTSDLFGETIHAYTRAEALADGVLHDISAAAKRVGITYPVAMTQSAWNLAVALSPAAIRACNDETGRLNDVVYMLRYAVNSNAPTTPRGVGTSLLFRLYAVTTRVRPSLITLEAIVGPGDAGEPVITIQLPHED